MKEIFKAVKYKKEITFEEIAMKLTSNFPIKIIEAKRG